MLDAQLESVVVSSLTPNPSLQALILLYGGQEFFMQFRVELQFHGLGEASPSFSTLSTFTRTGTRDTAHLQLDTDSTIRSRTDWLSDLQAAQFHGASALVGLHSHRALMQ